MGCEKTQRLLCEYLDSELNEVEAKYVEKHIGECFNCLKEYEALKKMALVVGALPDISVPKDFRKELSARLDNQKASVFSIFTKQRVWVPLASVTLAAMFLIFVYNKEYTFLDTKESQKTRAVFGNKTPVSDTVHAPAQRPFSYTQNNGYTIHARSVDRLNTGTKPSMPAQPVKNNEINIAKETLEKVPADVKTADKSRKKLKETSPAKSEQEETNKGNKTIPETSVSTPAPAITMDDTRNEKPDEDNADEVKEKNLAKKMRSEEKTPDEPSIPFGEKADVAKEGYAPADGKQKNLPAPGSPSLAKDKAPSLNGTPAATETGMMGGMETTDEEVKKDVPGKKKNAKITIIDNDVNLTAPANVSILHVDIFAPNPDNAVNEIMSIVKSYKLDYSFYRTITVTVPQNKINFLIGKLKAAGTVEMKSKFEPESSVPVKVKIMVKQKEEK